MKKVLAILALLAATPAAAQTDSFLALNGTFKSPFGLANTWTGAQIFNGPVTLNGAVTQALGQFHFFIGNGSGVSTDTALAGDCTYGASGIICTKTNNVAFATLATKASPVCADLTNSAPSCSTDTTNAANISSGTLPAGRMPALTGDVTSTVGTVATTIAANAVTNAKLAQAGADTLKGNPTGSTANETDTQTPVLGTNGGTGGSITLNGSTSGSVIIQTAAAAGTGTKFQLPANNGAVNNVLSTDGTGILSWAAGGGGTGGLVSIVAYSSTQTITIPATATKSFNRMWGGSGGSGGANASGNYAASGGSGAAGYLEKYLTGLTPGNTLAYTQGALGAAGTSSTSGGNGTASTLASGTQSITTLTANGSNGTAVAANSTQTAGTAGGTATNGDVNITGDSGQAGIVADSGGSSTATGQGGKAGSSLFAPGANGAANIAATAGIAGRSGGLVIFWFQ